jgi:hypothetical protein
MGAHKPCDCDTHGCTRGSAAHPTVIVRSREHPHANRRAWRPPLHPSTRSLIHAEIWDQERGGWIPALRDISYIAATDGPGARTMRQNSCSLKEKYRDWNMEMHKQYDKQVRRPHGLHARSTPPLGDTPPLRGCRASPARRAVEAKRS